MYKKIMLASVLAAVAIIPNANAFDLAANATATIQQAISATELTPMNFANIIPNASANGIAILSPAGTVSNGEGATMSYSGSAVAGQFTITAAPSTQMNITFANGTLTSGANTMALDTFTTDSTPASNTTDASGDLALRVGASLHVGTNQPAGTYAGTYTVMVNY